jgi:hypothetical protein
MKSRHVRRETTGLEINPLPGRPLEWDRGIRHFPAKTLFHESGWLDFMATMHPRGKIEYFEIRRNGSRAGYFSVLRVKKTVFWVYGSPLLGSAMYQGPLVDEDVDQAEVIAALVRLARKNRIAQLELASDWLNPSVMRELGFKESTSVTHVCPLLKDEASAWAALKGTCRTRIRKAEKSGLVAEHTTDPAIAADFYRYYSSVLKLKGLVPEYAVERPRALMACLIPKDQLFAIRVKYQNQVIGAGFYPHDERAMYYWDSASDAALLYLCPNELLHWTAMKLAISRGIPTFNIGGGPRPSRFTQKFGGGVVSYSTYRKSFVPLLETARQLHHFIDAVSESIGARA